MAVVFYTILLGLLGFLGLLAWRATNHLWGRFMVLRFIAEDVYGVVPMAKRHFILLVGAWTLVVIGSLSLFLPLVATMLVCIAASMKGVVERSSPQVARRLLFYALLTAVVVVFTLVGFVVFIFAMAGRREAVRQEALEGFRQWQNLRDVTAANRIT